MPFDYGGKGDGLSLLGCVKAAADGDYAPWQSHVVRRLGAPVGGNWNDYPFYDTPILWLLGLVARCSSVWVASNVMLLGGHVTSGLSAYGAWRWGGMRRPWAWGLAVVWAFSAYHVFRSFGHGMLAYDFCVPLGVVMSWKVAGILAKENEGHEKRRQKGIVWAALGLSLVVGQMSPYDVVGWLLVMGIAVASGVRTGLRLAMAWQGAAVLAVVVLATVGSFAVANLPTIIERARHGGNPAALSRAEWMSEQFGLKLEELAVPAYWHRLPAAGKLGRLYAEQAVCKGEIFSPYLGLAGLAGLALVVLGALRGWSLGAVQCAGIAAWACVGGGNCLLALWLTYWRGGNRWSVWILAICLLTLGRALSGRNLRKGLAWLMAVGLAVVALWDQAALAPRCAAEEGHANCPGDRRVIRMRMENDREFGRALEARLAGKAVFQLPVMQMNDQPPLLGCNGNDLLRPWYWTRTVRFSHGRILGRPEDNWRLEQFSGTHKGAEVVRSLREHGFAALYFFRPGYVDGAAAAIAELKKQGLTEQIVDGAGEQVVVMLEGKGK
jgi:hypothetical protein